MNRRQRSDGNNRAVRNVNMHELPKANESLKQWMGGLETIWAQLSHRLKHDRLFYFYKDFQMRVLPGIQAWELELQQIYQLVVCLYMLEKLDQTGPKDSFTYNYYTKLPKVMEACVEKLLEANQALDVQFARDQYRSALEWMKDVLHRGVISEQRSFIDWSALHTQLWSRCLLEREQVASEKERLEAKCEETGLKEQIKTRLVRVLAHFDLLLDEDDAAFVRLAEHLPPFALGVYNVYANQLWQAAKYERLVVWLRRCLPFVHKAETFDKGNYMTLWRGIQAATGGEDEYVQILRELLPFSFEEYNAWLLKRDRLKEWVDLQISLRKSPLNLNGAMLRKIEALEPTLLLPIYHIAIEDYITERNREAYRDAVICFQSLERLYDLLQQRARWEQFIAQFTKQYSRLRALHEELKRGKIL